jgi:hypothetical protein
MGDLDTNSDGLLVSGFRVATEGNLLTSATSGLEV